MKSDVEVYFENYIIENGIKKIICDVPGSWLVSLNNNSNNLIQAQEVPIGIAAWDPFDS